jgi:hypothetical protein
MDTMNRIERELINVFPYTDMGKVKSCDMEGEPLGAYNVWFDTLKEAERCRVALSNGRNVKVALINVDSTWNVDNVTIATPNIENRELEAMRIMGEDY